MGYFKGIVYCCLWISSIAAGYALLFCPLFPLLLISNHAYRYIMDLVFTFWQLYPTALLQVLCNCRLLITGDEIIPGTTSVLVMNHRTRTDWNFLWPAMYHCTGTSAQTGTLARFLHPLKFVLKDAIRHIPGPGWVMQLACFAFIKRLWNVDEYRLGNLIHYYTSLKYKYALVMFPEGTDFTPHTRNGSDRYAEKNNLEKYEFILHPRTRGFTYLVSELLKKKSLDFIYDVTLLYPDFIPQQEIELLKGNFPKQVLMHFKRFDKTIIPTSESELKKFLEMLWYKKEETFKRYYSTGNFLTGSKQQQNSNLEIRFALIFWTLLPFVAGYLFLINTTFQLIVLMHTGFLLFLNLFANGFQEFEISVYKFKSKFVSEPW